MDPFESFGLPDRNIKKELEDDLKKSEAKIKTFPHAKNITQDDPNTWGGAFLVPSGVKKGRCPVSRYVYEEKVSTYWKNIVFHRSGDDVLFYFNPDEITITIDQDNIIVMDSNGTKKLSFERKIN
jgi:hypothetical protein